MRTSYKNRFYIQLFILLGMLAGLSFSAWYAFGYIAEAKDAVIAARSEIAQRDAEQDSISILFKDYADVEPQIPALDGMFLPSGDTLSFVQLVESIAKETSVYHVIDAAGDAPAAKATLFNVTVFGPFPNALRFLALLEHSQYYLTVSGLQVALASGGTGVGGVVLGEDAVRMQLSIKVYTL